MASQHPLTQSTRHVSTLGLPNAVVSLLSRLGFESVADLAGLTQDELKREMGWDAGRALPNALLEYLAGPSTHPAVTAGLRNEPPPTPQGLPALQSQNNAPSSTFLSSVAPRTYLTPSRALNSLLSHGTAPLWLNGVQVPPNPEGGLRSRYVLEISGPPGSGKGSMALELIRCAVSRKEWVLVVETQSALNPGRVISALGSLVDEDASVPNSIEDPEPQLSDLVLHASVPTIAHLMAFINTLPSYLESNPKISLIVFSMMSFVFQPTESLNLSNPSRNYLYERIKHTMTLACMQNGVTIVVTNQTSTKLVGVDGSRSTFDAGARAVLQSQLGSGFLAASRSYRVMLYRDQNGVRQAKLDSSPSLASAAAVASSSRNGKGKRTSDGYLKPSSSASNVLNVAFQIDSFGRVRDLE